MQDMKMQDMKLQDMKLQDKIVSGVLHYYEVCSYLLLLFS